jgi:hypothetical protein
MSNRESNGQMIGLMTAEHSAQESPLSAKILLPFCYLFWHTLVRLETKAEESVLKSPSLKCQKKQGLPQFCWLFESGLLESPLSAMILRPYKAVTFEVMAVACPDCSGCVVRTGEQQRQGIRKKKICYACYTNHRD